MAERVTEEEAKEIRELRDKGYKVSYIAKVTGRSPDTVSRHTGKSKGYYWSEEEIDKAIELREKEKLTYKEIGAHLNRNEMCVCQIFFKIRNKIIKR